MEKTVHDLLEPRTDGCKKPLPPFPNTTAGGHCQTEYAGAALRLAQHDAVRDRDVDRQCEPVRRHIQRRQLVRLPHSAGFHRQRATACERGVRETRRRLEACG